MKEYKRILEMSFTNQQAINDEIEKLDARKEEMTDGEYIIEMNIIRDAWKLLKSSSDSDGDSDGDSDDSDGIEFELFAFPSEARYKEPTPIGIFEFYKDIENCYYIFFYPIDGDEEIYMKDWNDKSFKKYISIGREMPEEFLKSIKNTFKDFNQN